MKNKIKITDILFWLLIIILMSISVYALFRGVLW